MNNENTDVAKILASEFSENIVYSSSSNTTKTIISIFLIHNTYNDELVSKKNNGLLFRNIRTKRDYFVSQTASSQEGEAHIDYLPVTIDYNLYPTSTDENAEAVAFSIGQKCIICYRVNSKGLFIEKYNYRREYEEISVSYYNQEALKSFLSIEGELGDNYKTLASIVEKIGISIKKPSTLNNLDKLPDINPDSQIEFHFNYWSKHDLCIDIIKNGIYVDGLALSYLEAIYHSFYSFFLSFMRNQGFYEDNTNPLLIRKR